MKKSTSDLAAQPNGLPLPNSIPAGTAERPVDISGASQSAQPSNLGGYIARALDTANETLAQPTRFFLPVFSVMRAENALATDDVDAFLDTVSALFRTNMARASGLMAYFHPELSAAPDGNQAQWRVGEHLLRSAAERDAARCLQALLDFARVNPNVAQTLENPIPGAQILQIDQINRLGKTPLMVAAKAGALRSIDILLANGADPHFADGAKRTALLVAAEAGQPGSIERLIPVSRPNWRDSEGRTALMICAQRARRDMVDPIACLKALASVSHIHAVNKHKQSALSLAMTKPDAHEVFEALNPFSQDRDWAGVNREGRTLLDQAIENGYAASARWLVVNQRASLTRRTTRNWKGREFSSTPLIDLMANGRKPPSMDILDTLIELSNLRDENDDGETALSAAFGQLSRVFGMLAAPWWPVIDRLAAADLGQPFFLATVWPVEIQRKNLPRASAGMEAQSLRAEIGLPDPRGSSPTASDTVDADGIGESPNTAKKTGDSTDNGPPRHSANALARRRI